MVSGTKIPPIYSVDGVAFYKLKYFKNGDYLPIDQDMTITEFCELMLVEFKEELDNERSGSFVVFHGESHYPDGDSRQFTLTSSTVRAVGSGETITNSLAELIY